MQMLSGTSTVCRSSIGRISAPSDSAMTMLPKPVMASAV